MRKRNGKTLLMVLALAGLFPASVRASYGPPGERTPPEPPPQAIAACQDKSEGASVAMSTPRGDSVQAVCQRVGGRLVAVPEGGPPTGDGAPPQDGGHER